MKSPKPPVTQTPIQPFRRPTPSPMSGSYTELPQLKRRFRQSMDAIPQGRDATTEDMFRITRIGPQNPETFPANVDPQREQTLRRGPVSRLTQKKPRLMDASLYSTTFGDAQCRARDRIASRLIKDNDVLPCQVEPIPQENSLDFNRHLVENLVTMPFVEGRSYDESERQVPGITRYGVVYAPIPPRPETRGKSARYGGAAYGHAGQCRFPHHNVCDGRSRVLQARERRTQNGPGIPFNMHAQGQRMFDQDEPPSTANTAAATTKVFTTSSNTSLSQ